MKKRKLKKSGKFILSFILLILITCCVSIFYKPKETPTEKEKIDYLSLVIDKLNTVDTSFLKWVNDNDSEAMEKIYQELEKKDYDISIWHKVTGNSFIVLNDLYKNAYENMSNVTIIDSKHKDTILSFVGDVSLADNWHVAPKYDERGKGVYGILSENVVNEMKNSDVMVVNSEFTVSNRGTPMNGKLYTFRAKPERLSIYNEMGVDLVTLANNHVYDFGKDAFLDTLDLFDEMNMPRIGAGRNLEEASKPYYFIVNGYKYAFLNSTRAEKYILTPGAEENKEGVFRSYDPSRMIEKIKEVKENADFVITIVHYGKEGSHELEKEQIESSKLFIDAGSDAVVGHHAHTLQGFEFYKDKIIAYNLGNFIFNANDIDTVIFQIRINTDGNFEYYVLPAIQSEIYTRFADDEEKQRIINDLNSWSINATIDSSGQIVQSN